HLVLYEVESCVSLPPPSASVGTATVLPPLVGRERVLEYLAAAFSEAGSGSGGLVVLAGEPGIGKTRVAEMLAREATSMRIPVAWGYCRELGDTVPLWPFA